MINKIVPMLHVPDVAATMEWFQRVGFEIRATHQEDGCGLVWASLIFNGCEVMLSSGGVVSTARRRGADLYIHTDQLDVLYQRIAPQVEVVEHIHETEYGMREFIIRNPDRFWLTFGEPAK